MSNSKKERRFSALFVKCPKLKGLCLLQDYLPRSPWPPVISCRDGGRREDQHGSLLPDKPRSSAHYLYLLTAGQDPIMWAGTAIRGWEMQCSGCEHLWQINCHDERPANFCKKYQNSLRVAYIYQNQDFFPFFVSLYSPITLHKWNYIPVCNKC